MTIQELILAKLKTKFPGVDDAILTRIASKKAENVTDETKVDSIVEGIGFQDVLTSYGDFRADGATRSSIQNYEKKHNLKDGKPIEDPTPKPTPTPQPTPPEDMAKMIADAVSAAVKPFSEKLSSMELEKAHATRLEQILSKAKEYGIPENYAKRCAIKDDEDLDVYFKDLKQEFSNAGFQGVTPPETAEQKIEKNSQEVASLIGKGTDELNKK